MPTIEIDFETFKEITIRRTSEAMTEGEVVRDALGLNKKNPRKFGPNPDEFWESEGVKFPIGSELEHVFRDGRVVNAKVVSGGLMVDGKVYSGLSPAGVATAGYQLNGWRFWYVRNNKGRWVTADTLRG